MFRVAIPNKGSLSVSATNLLSEAGYKVRKNDRQLVLQDLDNEIEFFYLRPRDIAVYVGSGTLDVGITGLDLLLDSAGLGETVNALRVQNLGFAASSFYFAVPNGAKYRAVDDLEGVSIATSYANLVAKYLYERNITPRQIVRLDGAVESSIQLGVADVIADVVSTGTTLRQAGLSLLGEPILQSEAVLIRSPKVAENSEHLQILSQRLSGVITAHKFVMMHFDIETRLLPDAKKIAPGFENPTVSELLGEVDGQKWSAASVMVERRNMNSVMDQLYKIGARAIIATEILASRL
jgi:ATP phosphoribosyltransferase